MEGKKNSKKDELGKLGEKMAVDHLLKKGYSILKTNFVFDRAEVDIIAMKGDRIVVAEVKTRETAYLNEPGLMVPVKKQKQVIKAADAYIRLNNISLETRFDIISIVTNRNYTKIEHIEDAFYAGL